MMSYAYKHHRIMIANKFLNRPREKVFHSVMLLFLKLLLLLEGKKKQEKLIHFACHIFRSNKIDELKRAVFRCIVFPGKPIMKNLVTLMVLGKF